MLAFMFLFSRKILAIYAKKGKNFIIYLEQTALRAKIVIQ